MDKNIVKNSLILSLMLVISFSTILVQAAEVWGENLDEKDLGDLTDWQFMGWDMDNGNHTSQIDHGFDIINGV